jgi:hypothetical protein
MKHHKEDGMREYKTPKRYSVDEAALFFWIDAWVDLIGAVRDGLDDYAAMLTRRIARLEREEQIENGMV